MLDKDTIEVSDDHLLLSNKLEEHNITVQQLSNMTGRACSTLYRYLMGGQTIPSIVWRVIYQKTKDQEILKLITGDLPLVIADMSEILDPNFGIPELRKIMEMRQAQLDSEQNIVNILADGKIDASDRKEIEEYRKNIKQQLRTEYQIYLTIDRLYEKAIRNA